MIGWPELLIFLCFGGIIWNWYRSRVFVKIYQFFRKLFDSRSQW